jgi:DNA-binding MarR family transcriptional regulator
MTSRLTSEWHVSRREGRSPGPDSGTSNSEREFVIEGSFGYLLNRAARVLAHRLNERLRPHGVGIGQWAVLMFLWARDGMSQAELSRSVAIEPPTMVRTVDRLVRDGLVTRTPDPADGRTTRIRLTQRGWAVRDELVPEAVAVNRAVTESLTEDELTTVVRVLQRLVDEAPASA